MTLTKQLRSLTAAEKIAARFFDDGERFEDADGVDLVAALTAAGAVDRRRNGRWELPDGSAIVVASDAWDVGVTADDGEDISACTCWPDSRRECAACEAAREAEEDDRLLREAEEDAACQCCQITGVYCPAGEREDARVLIEHMPPRLRARHAATSGEVWWLLKVAPECAAAHCDGEWTVEAEVSL